LDGVNYVAGPVNPNGETHLALVIDPDQVKSFMNGMPSREHARASKKQIHADQLFFGGRPGSTANWPGLLSSIRLYNRALLAPDIKSLADSWRASRKDFTPANVDILRARVTEVSAIPAPEDIAPYRRGLVVNEYEIIEGDRTGERILAAHWAILDGVVLDTAERPLDSQHTLHVALFDERPELEGERVSMDTSDITLPLHYDLNL
jgi:hypothetical protein